MSDKEVKMELLQEIKKVARKFMDSPKIVGLTMAVIGIIIFPLVLIGEINGLYVEGAVISAISITPFMTLIWIVIAHQVDVLRYLKMAIGFDIGAGLSLIYLRWLVYSRGIAVKDTVYDAIPYGIGMAIFIATAVYFWSRAIQNKQAGNKINKTVS